MIFTFLVLQKVDLKVSIDCCDGCKRKVKKLLQNIEGTTDQAASFLQINVLTFRTMIKLGSVTYKPSHQTGFQES